MTGSERRDQIINQIKKSSIPVSGAQLAKEFDVSRQVIVQDIALIRAAGHEIISTNRGYLLNTAFFNLIYDLISAFRTCHKYCSSLSFSASLFHCMDLCDRNRISGSHCIQNGVDQFQICGHCFIHFVLCDQWNCGIYLQSVCQIRTYGNP
jgi:biotin operon repressor